MCKAPCLGCANRSAACRLVCVAWHEYEKQHLAEKEAYTRAKKLEQSFCSIEISRIFGK